MAANLRNRIRRLTSATAVAIAAVTALATGAALFALGHQRGADIVWAALVAVLLVPLCVSVARTLGRGDVGVDAIALIAMAGALRLGEYLAGAVIALMLAGGNALEERAGGRARRELTALVSRAPAPRCPRDRRQRSRTCRSRRSRRAISCRSAAER